MSTVHYLELVTHERDATCAVYEALWGTRFGEPIADMGDARTTERPDGVHVGVRTPMAEHETPIVRTYLAVDDIQAAVAAAEAQGAVVAYPPTEQGAYGTFAIVLLGDVQHGFWQAPAQAR